MRILYALIFVCLSGLPLLADDSVEVYEVNSPDEIVNTVDTEGDSAQPADSEPEANDETASDSIRGNTLKEIAQPITQEYTIDEMYKRGETFLNNKEYDLAAKEYKSIIRKNNREANAYDKLAKTYDFQEDYERESSTYQLLYKIFPAKENNDKLQASLKKFVNQLNKFYLQYPSEAMIPAKIAEVYYKIGDPDKAEKFAKEAIGLKKTTAKAYYILALLFRDKKDLQRAYENITAAFGFEPETQEYFQLLNTISKMREKEQESRPKVETKEIIDTPYFTNALRLIERKEYIQALEQLEKAQEQFPNNKEILARITEVQKLKREASEALLALNMGVAWFADGKYNLTVEKYQKEIIDKNRVNLVDYLSFYSLLLRSYYNLGRWDDCIRTSNLLLEQVPIAVEAYYYAGLSCEQTGKNDQAFKYFLKAMTLPVELVKHPEFRRTLESKVFYYKLRKNSGWIFLLILLTSGLAGGGWFLFNQGPFKKKRLLGKLQSAFEERKVSEVSDLYRKLEKMPLSPSETKSVYGIWAESNFQQGNYEKSLTALKNVIKVDPNDIQSHSLIAKIFLKKEILSDEALYEYARLIKKEPNNIELLHLIVKFFNSSGEKLFEKWNKTFGNDLPLILETLYRLEPANPEVLHLWTILALKEKRSDDKSREIYERYLEFNKDEKLALQIKPILLRGYYNLQKHEKALNLGVELLEKIPEEKELFMIVADICEQEDKITWLLAHLEKMANKNPGRSAFREYISQLREKIKLRENQIVDASDSKVGELSVDEVKNLFEEGKELFKSGELNQAIAFFRKCFKFSPDTFMQHRSSKLLILSYLRKGLFDLANEQYKITNFDEIGMSPDLKELCYLIGEAFEKAGLFEDAMQMYDKICRVDVSYRDSFDRFERLRNYVEKNESI
ncbi:MAG: tetratricopeptide repeat protein [Candidatus Wallbacteria bacterium]|nr:tetratricopeptide repeat protein [Candidatus Wallbacteria bacterium]